jgi:hypothetical protein
MMLLGSSASDQLIAIGFGQMQVNEIISVQMSDFLSFE